MVRVIQWIIGLALAIGVGSTLANHTLEVAKAAAQAHQYDQMSYGKFTRALLSAKPKQKK